MGTTTTHMPSPRWISNNHMKIHENHGIKRSKHLMIGDEGAYKLVWSADPDYVNNHIQWHHPVNLRYWVRLNQRSYTIEKDIDMVKKLLEMYIIIWIILFLGQNNHRITLAYFQGFTYAVDAGSTSSALYTLQNKNTIQTLPRCIVLCPYGYAHHSSDASCLEFICYIPYSFNSVQT